MDLTGHVFGRLTVVRLDHMDTKNHRKMWLCQCTCGKTTVTSTATLTSGQSTSCGCKKDELFVAGNRLRRKDLTGQIFGRLTVLQFIGRPKKSMYLCRCECGTEKVLAIDVLQSGRVVSCGCYNREKSKWASVTHNLSRNPLYFVWAGMMDRCYKETFEDYHNYGGRGIKVAEEWHDVRQFVEDMTPGYQKGLQLERMRNDEGYSKSNCRWVTRKQNNRNKRTNVHLTVNGETRILVEWAEITGIPVQSIGARVKKGLTGEMALYGPFYLKRNNISHHSNSTTTL
jgi:hypothetical protein